MVTDVNRVARCPASCIYKTCPLCQDALSVLSNTLQKLGSFFVCLFFVVFILPQ